MSDVLLYGFRAMFTHAMKEQHQDKIELNGVSAIGVDHLIHYAYTSKLTIDLCKYTTLKFIPLKTVLTCSMQICTTSRITLMVHFILIIFLLCR